MNFISQALQSASQFCHHIAEDPDMAVTTTLIGAIALAAIGYQCLCRGRPAAALDRIAPWPKPQPGTASGAGISPSLSARNFEFGDVKVADSFRRAPMSLSAVARHPADFDEKKLRPQSASSSSLPVLSPEENDQVNYPDLHLVNQFANHIVKELQPEIGDGDSYDFVATYKSNSIVAENTKAGSITTLAAASFAAARVMQGRHARRSLSEAGPAREASAPPGRLMAQGQDELADEQILMMGESVLNPNKKSGQCDHMAASVILSIVNHIKGGGQWHTPVELVGNGGHAFILMGRNGDINQPKTWGKGTILVDTWLGRLGVHDNYKEKLSVGFHGNGVVSNRNDIVGNVKVFGGVKVLRRFSVDDLYRLAGKPKSS